MPDYPHSVQYLNSVRTLTDPKAEDIIEKLCEHYQLSQVDSLFRSISAHFEESKFPPAITEFVEDLGTLPAWADKDQLKKGQQVFWNYGREIILALLCRSLPMSYVCANGADVLTATTRLIDFPRNPKFSRRLMETLQFVVDVCSDDTGIHSPGKGLIAVKKCALSTPPSGVLSGKTEACRQARVRPLTRKTC